MKKSFFAAGVLFGTAGIILLTSNAAHPRRLPLYRVLPSAFDSARRGRSACADRFRTFAQSFRLGHFAQEHDRSFAETAGKSERTADRIKPQRRQKILPPLFFCRFVKNGKKHLCAPRERKRPQRVRPCSIMSDKASAVLKLHRVLLCKVLLFVFL